MATRLKIQSLDEFKSTLEAEAKRLHMSLDELLHPDNVTKSRLAMKALKWFDDNILVVQDDLPPVA